MQLNQLHQFKDITTEIHKLRDEYLKRDIYPDEVNNGYCIEFAKEIIKRMDEGQILGDKYQELGHVFIKYNNRYYDAEAPNGRSRWYDLPFYQRRRSARDGRKRDS